MGALVADVLLARLAGSWKAWAYGLQAVTAVAALLIWAGHLIGYAIVGPVLWPVTLWGGSLVLTAFAGAALGGLVWRGAGAESAAQSAV